MGIVLINKQRLLEGLRPIRRKHSPDGHIFVFYDPNEDVSLGAVFLEKMILRKAKLIFHNPYMKWEMHFDKTYDHEKEVLIYLQKVHNNSML
jgi:hypothetical protein